MKMLGRKRTVETCKYGCCDAEHKKALPQHVRRMKRIERREWKKEVRV